MEKGKNKIKDSFTRLRVYTYLAKSRNASLLFCVSLLKKKLGLKITPPNAIQQPLSDTNI